MKETLENLDIDIEASEEPVKKYLTADEIPWDPEATPDDILTEETDESEEEVEVEEETSAEAETEEIVAEVAEDEAPEEEPSAEIEAPEEVIVDVDNTEDAVLNTVSDAIEQLQEYDDDMEAQFEPIKIDGKEYTIDKIDSFVDEEENILVVGVNCEEADEKSDDTDSNIEPETADEETPVETIEEVDETEESADDDGDEEVIESLKEMIRQKEALETEVNALRKAKSVGDAKEQELQEKLNRYRTAFRTTSAEAAKVPELQSKVKELTEKLAQSQSNVKTLTEKVNKAQQLKESIEGSKASERRLTEEVSRLTKKSEALEAKLEGQTRVYTEKLQERTNLAKTYKARFIETLTKYVESKANMLGVAPSEITSRLNESYTLADVDAVCDQILDTTVNFSRLPFGGRAKASARITESVSKQAADYDDDGFRDLLVLAGLN